MTLYSPEKAVEVAAMMQVEDPDWTYTPVPRGSYCAVEVRDESGVVVGYV